MMSQSISTFEPKPIPPMQLSTTVDISSSRRQLEDMARRGQRFCSLPPVPELSTPSDGSMNESTRTETSQTQAQSISEKSPVASSEPVVTTQVSPAQHVQNVMTTSKLFQEFSNRHLREQGKTVLNLLKISPNQFRPLLSMFDCSIIISSIRSKFLCQFTVFRSLT